MREQSTARRKGVIIAPLIALAMVLSACAVAATPVPPASPSPRPSPSPSPSPQPASLASFVAYLEGRGEAFTPGDPPLEPSANAVVQRLRSQGQVPLGADVDPPIYGVLACAPGPCELGAPLASGATGLAVWFVGWADSAGVVGWAVVDATTGEVIRGF